MPVSDPAVLYMPQDGLDVSAGVEIFVASGLSVKELVGLPPHGQVRGVVALLAGYDQIDGSLLDRFPDLRVVATHSAGVDMVDAEEIRDRRIQLVNLPSGATEEVAAHALAMSLAAIRQLGRYDHQVRNGSWDDTGDRPLPRVPGALTCGVLGLGRIGRTFAALAQPLFAKVVGYDPHLPVGAWPAGVERIDDVNGLMGVADCLSLHLPLSASTRHLVNGSRLARMPDGAVLVNVSRGELIDTVALVRELESGRLAGAALDVFEQEPLPSGHPLLARDDVLLSPHVGYLSKAALRRYAETPARNVIELLTSGRPPTAGINPGELSERSAP